MELILAYLIPVVLIWVGLSLLSSRFPAFRPLYQAYGRFWRWALGRIWNWLWKAGPEKRGGGRLNIPDISFRSQTRSTGGRGNEFA